MERFALDVETLSAENAMAVKARLKKAIGDGVKIVDLSAVRQADSVGLAIVLWLNREALSRTPTFAIEGLPEEILALARVYGIESVLKA